MEANPFVTLWLNLWAVLQPALTALVVAAIVYGIKLLRDFIMEQKEESFIKTLVRAAEQMMSQFPGQDRKAWVLATFKELFPKARIDNVLLDKILEDEVFQVNQIKRVSEAGAAGALTTEEPFAGKAVLRVNPAPDSLG